MSTGNLPQNRPGGPAPGVAVQAGADLVLVGDPAALDRYRDGGQVWATPVAWPDGRQALLLSLSGQGNQPPARRYGTVAPAAPGRAGGGRVYAGPMYRAAAPLDGPRPVPPAAAPHRPVPPPGPAPRVWPLSRLQPWQETTVVVSAATFGVAGGLWMAWQIAMAILAAIAAALSGAAAAVAAASSVLVGAAAVVGVVLVVRAATGRSIVVSQKVTIR